MNVVSGASADSSANDVNVADFLALETPRIMMNGISPTAALFHPHFLSSSDVPSTAEIIQKCLAVNPFDVKFREANRRISQTQDGPELNDMAPPPIPASAGISMLKLQSQLSQSPTIFSNISLLTAADLDLTRKLRESGFMNASSDGNRTPCTADVLNAVLDMNMNHHMAAAAVAAVNNHSAANMMIPPSSTLSTAPSIMTSVTTAIPETNGFNFQIPSTSTKILASSLQPPPASLAVAQASPASMPMPHTQIAPEISAATNTLTSLHAASSTPVASVTGLPIVLKTEQPDSVLSIDTNWEQDVKPDISGPPTKRLATDTLIGHQQQFYQSDESPFSNGSSVSSVANSRQSEEPIKTTRKYHSRCTDGQSTRGGRGRRSTTSDMPPDERRQTILERNKAAAVRYRKRKKEEHDEMITRVNLLEQDKNSFARKFQTQNTVLRREVERLTELLKLRESQCVCHAVQLGGPVQNILATLPPPDTSGSLDHSAFNMHLNRRPNN